MTETATPSQKMRLRAHYGFSKIPFGKRVWAAHMYDSSSQRNLRCALEMWTEIRGFALVSGPPGVGKSITLRRFVSDLDETRFDVYELGTLPATVNGFLRHLSRKLGIDVKNRTADLFDSVQKHLDSLESSIGPHPILIIDNAEGLNPNVVDVLRRLSTSGLDDDDRFSILISGTQDIIRILDVAELEPLRSRFSIAQQLKPFGLEDTRNYIRFHLKRADGNAELFSDAAVQKIFQLSTGRPRIINQLAIYTLVFGAIWGKDRIDSRFLTDILADHPLFKRNGGEE